MSASFLAAVATRAADCLAAPPPRVPSLSVDELSLILRFCDVLTRVRSALVCKAWFSVSRRPELYSTIDSLPRRMAYLTIMHFVELFCGEQTTELSLANMRNLDDVGIEFLLVLRKWEEGPSARMPRLRVLDLSANDIGDAAFMIPERLRDSCFGALRRLRLWAVTDMTNGAMAYLAGHCPLLEMLDLRMCGEVDGLGVRKLTEHCPMLADVRLRGLRRINDETVSALGRHCPRLVHADLSGAVCTDAGITALAAACPRLENLLLAGCKQARRQRGRRGARSSMPRAEDARSARLQHGWRPRRARARHALRLAAHGLVSVLPALSDGGFVEICRRCPLRHITLKLTSVTLEAVEAMRAAGADSERRGGPLNVVDLAESGARPPRHADAALAETRVRITTSRRAVDQLEGLLTGEPR